MPLASDAFMKDDVNISHPCLLYIHISDFFHTARFFAPGAFRLEELIIHRLMSR